MGEPLLRKLYEAGVRDLIVRPASGGDYVTATKNLRVRLPNGQQAGAIAQTDINGPVLSMLITQDGKGLVWCGTAGKAVNARTPELVRSRPRGVGQEIEDFLIIYVLWYRGGAGPGGGQTTSYRFEVRGRDPVSCTLQSAIVTHAVPADWLEGSIQIDGDGAGPYVEVCFSSRPANYRIVNTANLPFESAGSFPSPLGSFESGQRLEQVPPQSEEDWLADQPWQSIEYDFPVTASHSGGTLTVKNQADEVVDTISIDVVEFEITNDPDNNPDND